MGQILIFILGIVLGIAAGVGIGWFLKKRSDFKNSLIGKQAQEKEERKSRILDLIAEKGRLSNNDIERLLGVSDASATRYLGELEKEGKIKQVGEAGKYVYYSKDF